MSRIFTVPFAAVYPHYVAKAEKKGRTEDEVDHVIRWLTGFDRATLERHLAEGTTVEDVFAQAQLNPHASLITGMVCGARVESIEDPLMQKIRYLDKLVDEQSSEANPDKRKQLVWKIERVLAEAAVRPVIFYPRGATCQQPWVKGLTVMNNSIYNGWRMEDVWLDK